MEKRLASFDYLEPLLSLPLNPRIVLLEQRFNFKEGMQLVRPIQFVMISISILILQKKQISEGYILNTYTNYPCVYCSAGFLSSEADQRNTCAADRAIQTYCPYYSMLPCFQGGGDRSYSGANESSF
jgi:hypothetical protein